MRQGEAGARRNRDRRTGRRKDRRKIEGGRNMFSHVMLGCSDRERSKKFYDAMLAALGARAGPGLWQVRLVDDEAGRARHRPADRRSAVQHTAMARPSALSRPAPKRSMPGMPRESPTGERRSRIRPESAMRASARCTSPICAIPTATNSADSTGCRRTREPRDCERKQGSRRPAAGRKASVGRLAAPR